jgi:hypothetical protein
VTVGRATINIEPGFDQQIREAELLYKSQSAVYKDVLSHECNPYTNIFEFINYLREVKKDIE